MKTGVGKISLWNKYVIESLTPITVNLGEILFHNDKHIIKNHFKTFPRHSLVSFYQRSREKSSYKIKLAIPRQFSHIFTQARPYICMNHEREWTENKFLIINCNVQWVFKCNRICLLCAAGDVRKIPETEQKYNKRL